MGYFYCSWNGCMPVGIEAEDEQAAREEFERAARERGNEEVRAEDVEIES